MVTVRNRFSTENTNHKKYITKDEEEESKFYKPMPTSYFMGILGLVLLTFALVIIIEKQLPKALRIKDEKLHPDKFIAERAYNILENLTRIGPRTAGSYENEVLAVKVIKTEIDNIVKGSHPNHIVEVDVQKASGAFNLEFLDGMTNVYQDVQNIVVKVGSKINSPHSLLINCHFDTVVDSPGASDDGAGCAVMLEILRVLVHSDKILRHNIILLFNGGEENFMPASHGFITQHKWAKEVRAFINLEACGAGGREVLFQAGPNNPWILETYSEEVPYPYASSLAQEIFQSGVVPGDTDYRIFRDFGNISGLDFAWSANGYVYHTKFDSIKQVPLGSLQRTGDNILALAKGMAQGHQLSNIEYYRPGNLVFFDFLGAFVIRWPMAVADFIFISAVIVSIYCISANANEAKKYDNIKGKPYAIKLIKCMGVILLSWLLCVLFGVLTAGCLNGLGRTMSWYARPFWAFLLYVIPTLVISLVTILLHAKYYNKDLELSPWTVFQLYYDAYQAIWTIVLVIGVILRIRSSFIPLIWVFFASVGNILKSRLFGRWRDSKWLILYIFTIGLPFVQNFYLIIGAFYLFIPIMGRAGSGSHAEYVIGAMVTVLFSKLFGFAVPLILLVRKVERIFSFLIAIFLISVAVLLLTPLGFPYSGEPGILAPQRFMMAHTKRTFHDSSGAITNISNGYWIADMDINSPHTVDNYVPAMKRAELVEKDCVDYLYCGLPYLVPVLTMIRNTHWLPGNEPFLPKSVQMVIKERHKIDGEERFWFEINGPTHMGIMFSPAKGVEVKSWSVPTPHPLAGPQWNGRNTYFIYYAYGLDPVPFNFTIDFKIPSDHSGPIMDLAVTSHFLFGEGKATKDLENLVAQFPSWTAVTYWTASYESWRALEISDFDTMSSTPHMANRHLSKSASELSSPREMPDIRPRSAAPPEHSHISVYQKAHSFFAQLKTRLGHSKRERRHKSPGRQESSEYAADLSSEHSTPHSTPSTTSPRHRVYNRTADSPLSRTCGDTTNSPGGSPRPRAPTPGAVAGLDLLPLSSNDEITRRREAALRQHSFFQLRIYLRRGHGLVAMDKNGLSDPYVKFKVGGRLIYKSRTIYRDLNPIWDESFTVPIEDPFLPISIKVFDYDWGLQDDFMGSAILDLTTLDLGRNNDLALPLQDPSRPETCLGEIYVSATLYPKTQEDKEHYFQKNSRIQDVNKRLKSQIWSSVVTIVLIEGRNLLACDPETGTSDPYVKFRLGNEKYKSRIVWRSLNPRWLEQLDLHLYDDGDQQLEITVWDKDRTKDDYIGRCVINLLEMERERTYNLWLELEDGAGSIHLLLTISGTTASETISDLSSHEETARERENLINRYSWHKTFQNLKDVGHLTVKVFRATGLTAADIGGKSDPFCVLELGNARLQTQTEYKTLTPQWNKIFTFNVKDINNVLEVVVFDEDRDHKVEFLGKIAIPLLRIRNSEKRWYALKDKKLRSRAKGNSPQILLEMNIVWNPIRACIRTLNPKEEKFMQTEIKFKRQVFVRNVLRLKVFIMHFLEVGKFFQDCFEWESKFQSFAALVVWLILCYYFQPWMIPIGCLLMFFKQYVIRTLAGPASVPWDELADSDVDEEDEDDKEKEEKKSLKERLQAIQEVTQGVQNAIGKIASLLEGVRNMFNFTVPYLSLIAIGLLALATCVLYLIPIRYLLMLWATNKFLRRIFRPHVVPNNEILDLLSRIPDDEMLTYIKLLGVGLSSHLGRLSVIRWYLQLDYKDLKLLSAPDSERRANPKKKHKTS